MPNTRPRKSARKEGKVAVPEATTALELTDNIPVGTYVLLSPLRGPQRYTFLSKRWLEMTGLDPKKLKKDIAHYFSLVHPEDREAAIAHNVAGAAALKPYKWEGRWLKDGKVVWVSIESVPRKVPGLGVVWEGVFIDITARKEAEAQLLAAKEEFRALIDHLPVPVASTLHLPHQPVNFINKAFKATYGWTMADCPTMADWARCAYPDEKYRKAVFDEFNAEVAASVREKRLARPLEYRVTCKDGSIRDVRIDCLVAADMLFGSFLDITAQRDAEKALAEAREHERRSEATQRHELTRKLKTSLTAAAVAHEINQPLSAILLESNMALASAGDARDALALVAAEAGRVVTTVEKMKTLMRSVQTTHAPVDLATVANSALLYFRDLFPKLDITVLRSGLDRPHRVIGDDAQLQLAITNILRNAAEAIEESATDRREISVKLARRKDRVEISIGDSGAGWSGAEQTETPLTTTKKGGTGIGLYVVRTVMENHGGNIHFGKSRLGGAEVKLAFPRAQKESVA